MSFRIMNGQIISLSDLKTSRRGNSYRRATFKCLSSQIKTDKFDNESDSASASHQYKLIFSSKYINEEDMNYIYLGATLLDVAVHSIGTTYYVNSFTKIDTTASVTGSRTGYSNSANRRLCGAQAGRTDATAGDNLQHITVNDDNYRDLLQRLPDDIRGLFQYCSQFSNLSPLFSLAYSFANNISSQGSFYTVKLALMLSLVAQSEDPKNNCSLLVMCDDDLQINRLFAWACNFTKKYFVYSSTLHSLVSYATASNDTIESAALFESASQPMTQVAPFDRLVKSGTLNLAADGVHLFSSAVNLETLPRKEKAFLEHALESNEIIPKELIAGTDDISESKLKSIIWANIGTEASTSKRRATLAPLSQLETGTKSRWPELFGTVVVVKEAGLHRAEPQPILPVADWQRYFALCNTLDPTFSAAADCIVQKYFFLSRQYRPAGLFKAKSISILLLLSKCIAKLNLRNQVTTDDALLAVMLYEQQLAALHPAAMSPIVFPFLDLTHINEDDFGQRDLQALLDGTYMAAFERTLMDLFSSQDQMAVSSENVNPGPSM